MMPVSGFDVVGVEDGRCFAARTRDGTMSWGLDVEPRDRHSRRLICRRRAQWHITRSVRLGSRRPTRAPSSWNSEDCLRSRRDPSRPHGRARPLPLSRKALIPGHHAVKSGSLTSSGNALSGRSVPAIPPATDHHSSKYSAIWPIQRAGANSQTRASRRIADQEWRC